MELRSVRCEYVRLNELLSHNRIIRDNDSCPRFKLVSELVSKVRTEVQPRFQRLGVYRSAFIRHPHPSRFLVSRREPAGLPSRAFEHREHVIPELIAPGNSLATNLYRRASDRVTVAVDIHGPVG